MIGHVLLALNPKPARNIGSVASAPLGLHHHIDIGARSGQLHQRPVGRAAKLGHDQAIRALGHDFHVASPPLRAIAQRAFAQSGHADVRRETGKQHHRLWNCTDMVRSPAMHLVEPWHANDLDALGIRDLCTKLKVALDRRINQDPPAEERPASLAINLAPEILGARRPGIFLMQDDERHAESFQRRRQLPFRVIAEIAGNHGVNAVMGVESAPEPREKARYRIIAACALRRSRQIVVVVDLPRQKRARDGLKRFAGQTSRTSAAEVAAQGAESVVDEPRFGEYQHAPIGYPSSLAAPSLRQRRCVCIINRATAPGRPSLVARGKASDQPLNRAHQP